MPQRNLQPPATTFTVREATTLLPFIQSALDGISHTRAKAILRGGGVTVNRTICRQYDYPLSPGTTVHISRRKPGPTLTSRFLRLVYEDRDLIVVEKAPGILSMATGHHSFCVKTLLDEYFRRSRQQCTAHVVHRLDRDTSGLLVYAKTLQAEQILEHNWHCIVTDRRYVALLSGHLPQAEGTVESWLHEGKACYTLSTPYDDGGKYSVTHYRQLRSDGRHTLAEFRLETGRKNQIRVHMQSLRCPVCGDAKYGNGDDPLGRLALHAFRLFFRHPISDEPLAFETPLPPAFLRALGPEGPDQTAEGVNKGKKPRRPGRNA